MEEEKKKEQKQEETLQNKLKKMVEKELSQLLSIGIQDDNIDNFGKLIDIHKDIENEEYWKIKEEVYNNELRLWRI